MLNPHGCFNLKHDGAKKHSGGVKAVAGKNGAKASVGGVKAIAKR